MQADVIKVVQECTDESDQERVTFPEVVARLASAGIERYHADLLRAEKIYYLPSGESQRVQADPIAAVPPAAFAADGVAAAVRAIQRQQIPGRERHGQEAGEDAVRGVGHDTFRRAIRHAGDGSDLLERRQ